MAQELQTPHDFRFPGESGEYRRARDELLRAELDLRRHIERVTALRRDLPLGGAVGTDYVFEEWDSGAGAARPVRLSELFDDGKDTLFLYSFMVVPREQGLPFVGPCPSCTSIIDGIDGAVPHITQRMSFAVESAAPIAQFREHGSGRGWRHARLLSSAGNSYRRDYGGADSNDYQWPLATVFVRGDGEIHHYWSSELWWVAHDAGQGPRHVDFMWPLWAVFDRTPEGRGEWETKLDYG
jgi:predicted dithiol-disulfide oxidoreductase (DUF899 family)